VLGPPVPLTEVPVADPPTALVEICDGEVIGDRGGTGPVLGLKESDIGYSDDPHRRWPAGLHRSPRFSDVERPMTVRFPLRVRGPDSLTRLRSEYPSSEVAERLPRSPGDVPLSGCSPQAVPWVVIHRSRAGRTIANGQLHHLE